MTFGLQNLNFQRVPDFASRFAGFVYGGLTGALGIGLVVENLIAYSCHFSH